MKHATSLLSAAALVAGCQSWPQELALTFPKPGTGGPAPERRLVKALRHETVVQQVGPVYRSPSPTSPIVRCDAIESLVSLGGRAVPALRTAADSSHAVERRNARRALARLGQPSAQKLLIEVVTDPGQRPAGRLAAVRELTSAWPDEVQRLLGPLLARDELDQPAVVCYVMESLAKTDDPALADVFRARCASRDGQVRRVALGCLRRLDLDDMPEETIRGCADPVWQVRLEAVRLVTACPDPRALPAVLWCTRDQSKEVQAEAARALGALGGPGATARLTEMLNSPSEVVRTSVVDALANRRHMEGLWRARKDRSWRVRKRVVAGLGRCGMDAVRDKLARCLDDRSLYVQLEVVDVARRAPIGEAYPVLLEAVGRETYLVRQKAWDALRRHTPKTLRFDVPANRPVRSKQLAEIRAWWAEHGLGAPPPRTAPATPATRPTHLRTNVLAQVALLGCADPEQARQALARLKGLGPAVIPVIEKDVLSRPEGAPSLVLSSLLPALSPSYQALRLLQSRQARQRQRGAQIVGELEPPACVSPYVARRLADLLPAETDQLVWHYGLKALARDAPGLLPAPLKAGMRHKRTTVRRECLQWAGRLQVKAATADAIACLDDTSRSVKMAAAAALGHLDATPAGPALRRALVSRDAHLRLIVATSLARLRQRDGITHLELALASPDPTIRRLAANVLGDVGDKSCLAALIRTLKDPRMDVRRQVLSSLEKLSKVTFRVDAKGRRLTTPQMVRQWQRWWTTRDLARDTKRSRI